METAVGSPPEKLDSAVDLRLDPQGFVGTGHDRLPPPMLGQALTQLGLGPPPEASDLAHVADAALVRRGHQQAVEALLGARG